MLTDDRFVLNDIYDYFTKLSALENKKLVKQLVNKGAGKELVKKLQVLKKKHIKKMEIKNKKYGAKKSGTNS